MGNWQQTEQKGRCLGWAPWVQSDLHSHQSSSTSRVFFMVSTFSCKCCGSAGSKAKFLCCLQSRSKAEARLSGAALGGVLAALSCMLLFGKENSLDSEASAPGPCFLGGTTAKSLSLDFRPVSLKGNGSFYSLLCRALAKSEQQFKHKPCGARGTQRRKLVRVVAVAKPCPEQGESTGTAEPQPQQGQGHCSEQCPVSNEDN